LKVEGECLPGVKLAVTEGFDFYQWEIKNSAGNFINAPVTSQYPSNKEFYYILNRQVSIEFVSGKDHV
jgi:hypothetical protein